MRATLALNGLNHEVTWSKTNYFFLIPRSNHLMVYFHAKKSGKVSSAILPYMLQVNEKEKMKQNYKWYYCVCKETKYSTKKYKDFQVSLIKIWYKIPGRKFTENLRLVQSSNFIRESADAAVRGCSGINSQKNSIFIVTLQDLSL